MRLAVDICPSLTAEVVSKLEAHGIRSMRDLMLKDCEELAREVSISYRELRSIRRVAIAHHSVFAVSGQDLLQHAIHTTKVFSTGCKKLDRLLAGGLTTGEVVEVCGGLGEGKTTLCLQLALHAALELGVSILYVDPVGSLNHLRMNPIVEALPQDLEVVDDALSRIKVTGASDIWEVFGALSIPTQPFIPVRRGKIGQGGAQGGSVNLGKIKLVILDSLASVMMPLITREDSKQGLAIVNQLAMRLKTLAKEQQVVVVVVNGIVQAGSGQHHHTTSKPKWMPALGRFWRSVPHIRLYVKRTRGTDPPVFVDAASESECMAPKSPLELHVAVWKGTRIKGGKAVITLPLESLMPPGSEGSS